MFVDSVLQEFDVYEADKDHLYFHSLIAKGRTSVCSRNWYLIADRDPSVYGSERKN